MLRETKQITKASLKNYNIHTCATGYTIEGVY